MVETSSPAASNRTTVAVCSEPQFANRITAAVTPIAHLPTSKRNNCVLRDLQVIISNILKELARASKCHGQTMLSIRAEMVLCPCIRCVILVCC